MNFQSVYFIVGNYRIDWIFEKTAGGAFQSPPVVGPDGTIYAGSYDGNMYAIYPSGFEGWSFSTRSTGIYYSAAVVDIINGNIYFTASNNYLYALSSSGRYIWEYYVPGLSILDGSVYSSPALGTNGTVYVVANAVKSGTNLYAISFAGLYKWSINIGSTSQSSPAVGTDGTIYVGSCSSLLAVSPTGTVKWTYYVGSCLATPAIGPDGTIYVGSADGNLRAFSPTEGLKWTYETSGEITSPPAIQWDGTAYFKSGNSVYAVSAYGYLEWTYTTDSSWGRAVFGSDGRVYVESLNSLYVFTTDGHLQWQYTQGGHVAVSGAVYLASSDDGNLYALTELPRESNGQCLL